MDEGTAAVVVAVIGAVVGLVTFIWNEKKEKETAGELAAEKAESEAERVYKLWMAYKDEKISDQEREIERLRGELKRTSDGR